MDRLLETIRVVLGIACIAIGITTKTLWILLFSIVITVWCLYDLSKM